MSDLSAENLATVARLDPEPAAAAFWRGTVGKAVDRLMTAARIEGRSSVKTDSMGARTAFVAVCVAGIAVQVIVNPIATMFRLPTLRIGMAEMMILAGPLITYTFAKTIEKHIASQERAARAGRSQ
jgi:hypothetical protein